MYNESDDNQSEGENNNSFKTASAGLQTGAWGERFQSYLESALISELDAN